MDNCQDNYNDLNIVKDRKILQLRKDDFYNYDATIKNIIHMTKALNCLRLVMLRRLISSKNGKFITKGSITGIMLFFFED
jgi:hypothetical protein